MESQENSKVAEAGRENSSDGVEDEPLPTYEKEDSAGAAPSTLPEVSPSATPSDLPESHSLAVPSDLPESHVPAVGPSVSSPFNFPTTDLLPGPDPAPTQKPIAIPQRWPDPSAPFLAAYAPVLLNYGIPAATFHSFLDTLSAFLTAKVSKRAISHASDVAVSVGRVPKQLGKDLVAQAKDSGRLITSSAKKGNPFGVLGGLIGITLGMTVGIALRTVNSMLQLPAAAAMSATNPKTPRGRAELYIATANKKWFGPRGLHARLLDTNELTGLLGIGADGLLIAAGPTVSAEDTDEKLKPLRSWIADLKVRDSQRELKPPSKKDTPSTMPDPKPVQAVNTADAFSIDPTSASNDPAVSPIASSPSQDEKKDIRNSVVSPISPVDTTSAFSVLPVDTTSAFSIITDREQIDTTNAFSIEPKHNVDTTSAFSIEGESSVAAGRRPVQPSGKEKAAPLPPGSLRLDVPTLWVVLFPAERISKGKEKAGKEGT